MKRTVLTLAAAVAVALVAQSAHAWGGQGWSYHHGAYGSSFSAAADRIKAKHSRYGKSIHPRSYYNRPVYFPPPPTRSYGQYYEYHGRGYRFGY